MPDQTASLSVSHSPRPHPHLRASLTEQGGMLLDLRGRGRWFALTPSAALWWRHVQEGAPLPEATAAVAHRYRITVEQANTDLQPFIDELFRRRMLVPTMHSTRANATRWWWPW